MFELSIIIITYRRNEMETKEEIFCCCCSVHRIGSSVLVFQWAQRTVCCICDLYKLWFVSYGMIQKKRKWAITRDNVSLMVTMMIEPHLNSMPLARMHFVRSLRITSIHMLHYLTRCVLRVHDKYKNNNNNDIDLHKRRQDYNLHKF